MNHVRTTYLGSRPGGRSEDVRRRVLNAAADELLDRGFDRFAITSVADRAGVHHTTIYRRWPTKSRLVLDAVLELTRARLQPPDTGSLRTDLEVYFSAIAAALGEPRLAALIRGLVAIRPEEFAAERAEYWAERFAITGTIFVRAADRGEVVPQRDRLRVVELIGGPLWMRALVTGLPLEPHTIARLVDDALRAIGFAER